MFKAILNRAAYASACAAVFLLCCSCASVPVAGSLDNWQFTDGGFSFTNTKRSDRSKDFLTYNPETAGKKYGIIEVDLFKEQGQDDFGFGLIYNYTDDNNYSRLLIDARSNMSVMMKVEGVEYMQLGWTSIGFLKPGLGETNRIALVQHDPETVGIYANGQLAVTLSRTEPLTGIMGAFVAVGNKDAKPEDVMVRMTAVRIEELDADGAPAVSI